jgi:hypothetical protein
LSQGGVHDGSAARFFFGHGSSELLPLLWLLLLRTALRRGQASSQALEQSPAPPRRRGRVARCGPNTQPVCLSRASLDEQLPSLVGPILPRDNDRIAASIMMMAVVAVTVKNIVARRGGRRGRDYNVVVVGFTVRMTDPARPLSL